VLAKLGQLGPVYGLGEGSPPRARRWLQSLAGDFFEGLPELTVINNAAMECT